MARVGGRGVVGFKLNRATVARAMKSDPKIKAALAAAAEQVAGRVRADGNEVTTREYVTDRQAVAVVVNAADQARDGVGTRAANASRTRRPTRRRRSAR